MQGVTSDHWKQVMASDLRGDLGPSETHVLSWRGYQDPQLWSRDKSLGVSTPFQAVWSQGLEMIQRHVAGSCLIKMWWPQCGNWGFPLQCHVTCHLVPLWFIRVLIMGFWSLIDKAHFMGNGNTRLLKRALTFARFPHFAFSFIFFYGSLVQT